MREMTGRVIILPYQNLGLRRNWNVGGLEYWNDEKKQLVASYGLRVKKEIITIIARSAQLGTLNAVKFHYSITKSILKF